MNRLVFLVVFFVFALPYVNAQSGDIALLTVRDSNESVGGIASLHLNIAPGSGRVFIDSFPLSKLDTQISVRFANQVACDVVNIDCSKYDFFYTINADSSLVGGPSAGSAIAVLTASVLVGAPLDTKTAITGTINSGGTIGPVGGVDAKARAAKQSGFTRVLVPSLPGLGNASNLSDVDVEVMYVSTLEDALSVFTGRNFSLPSGNLTPPVWYSDTMKGVSEKLCERAEALLKSFADSKNASVLNESRLALNRSVVALDLGQYYSAASQCFTAGLSLRKIEFGDDSKEQLERKYRLLAHALSDLSQSTQKRVLRTLSDLEAEAIVLDRVVESKEVLRDQNSSNLSSVALAYAFERYNSAVVWSRFFDIEGERFFLDESHVREACVKRLEEAEERINYLSLYLGEGTVDRGAIDRAYGHLSAGEPSLCVFEASKAKAELNTILSSFFVSRDDLGLLVDQKLRQAEQVLLRQQSKGLFPIMGYSYYEYASFLRTEDPILSLQFAEYALELSNLDAYFPREKEVTPVSFKLDPGYMFGFIVGIVAGTLAMLPFVLRKNRKNGVKRTKRSR